MRTRQPYGYIGLQGYFAYEGCREQETLTSRHMKDQSTKHRKDQLLVTLSGSHYCLRVA